MADSTQIEERSTEPNSVAAPDVSEKRERLLGMRVSRIIEAHEGALAALIEGGFGPLANPVARLAMAHTVNLAQAFRIRGQAEEEQEALIAELLALGVADGAA
ncbi:MAG: hypothetical protein WDA03_09920 [Trueperaceae bacterium]